MAVDFLGVNEYLDCGSGPALDNIRTLTVSMWLYLDSIVDNNSDGLVEKYDRAGGLNGWLFFVNDDAGTANSYQLIQVWNVPVLARWRTAANTAVVGSWQHVAFTYNANSTANDPIFYINGVLSAATEITAPGGGITDDSAQTLKVAGEPVNSQYLDGRLEDVRVFNRILSAQEIAILAAGYRGPLGGEVCWLPMDGARAIGHFDGAVLVAATNYLNDVSGNANHGNPIGSPLGYASDCPRVGGITD